MESSQLKKSRREERKKSKQLSPKKRKAIAVICGIILFIAAAMFSVDLIRAKRYNLPPVFCVSVMEYSSGSTDYLGLFYKVWKDHDPFEDTTRYYVGFWLIPKSVNI